MSSTNRYNGDKRQAHDAYFTPPALARAVVGALDLPGLHPRPRILEPHVGEGAFLNAALERWPEATYVAFDVVNRQAHCPPGGVFMCEDFLATHEYAKYELIIGNPPYSRPTGRFSKKGTPMMEHAAEDHVRKALALSNDYVVFLLRLAFLESRERAKFWKAHPCWQVWALSERPSFTGGGTDSCAYGVFIWRKGWDNGTTLKVWSWR